MAEMGCHVRKIGAGEREREWGGETWQEGIVKQSENTKEQKRKREEQHDKLLEWILLPGNESLQVLLEVHQEWCVMRSVQSEIAARGVRNGVTQRGKKLWLKGRLRNGGVQSENIIYLAANMVAYWGLAKQKMNLLGRQKGCVMAA
eukprot:1148686-Pelagomonas_calceolata.AAC.8